MSRRTSTSFHYYPSLKYLKTAAPTRRQQRRAETPHAWKAGSAGPGRSPAGAGSRAVPPLAAFVETRDLNPASERIDPAAPVAAEETQP